MTNEQINKLLSTPKLFKRISFSSADYMESQNPQLGSGARKNNVVYVTQAMFMAELDPNGHRIYDQRVYPDKLITSDGLPPSDANEIIGKTPITRVSISMQQMIAKKNRVHMFGETPFLSHVDGSEERYKDIKKYFAYKNCQSILSRLCDSVNETGDGAILFFRDDIGGLRMKNISFKDGYSFNCKKDEYDDISEFWYEYSSTNDEGQISKHVVIYDKKTISYYKQNSDSDNKWVVDKASVLHGFKRVPVCYMKFNDAIWGTVQELIESLEECVSNLRENNKYFAYPTMKITGQGSEDSILPNAGTAGSVIALPADSDADYLKTADASNTLEMEIKTLKDFIFDLTGTVIIDQNSAKVGADSSGAAIRNMYAKAVEMAMWRASYWSDSLLNFINLFIEGIGLEKGIPSEFSSVKVGIEVVPYVPQNIMEEVTMLDQSVISGTLSQQTACESHPYASANEWERIQNEAKQKAEIENGSQVIPNEGDLQSEVLKIDNQLKNDKNKI